MCTRVSVLVCVYGYLRRKPQVSSDSQAGLAHQLSPEASVPRNSWPLPHFASPRSAQPHKPPPQQLYGRRSGAPTWVARRSSTCES